MYNTYMFSDLHQQVIGTNSLIKWWFRLKRMVCQVWAQECMPLNSHWLGTKNGGTDFHDCWLLILCSKSILVL